MKSLRLIDSNFAIDAHTNQRRNATFLTTQIAVSSLNTVTNSDTTPGHAFTVVAGDAVAIQVTQTNGGPTVRMATQCVVDDNTASRIPMASCVLIIL